MAIFSLTNEINQRVVVRMNMGLYRMITAAQWDDSHQSNCNRLKSGINAVTRDLVENELCVLQVERQLQHQNTRSLVE